MIEAMPAVAMKAAINAWRRVLRGTVVRLEAVRSPAAAVISVSVVEEFAEPRSEDASDGVEAADGGHHDSDAEAPDWEPPPAIGRYEIGEHLATSRLGLIYRARDTGNDADVEVTFLYADAVPAAAEAGTRLEELRTLRHLHVVPLLDWQLDPVPYLVYPAPVMRLESLIRAGVVLSPSQALLIGLQAAETLHNLQERGITNGALTPWHLCVDTQGRLRLDEMGVDFLRAPWTPEDASRYDDPQASGPVAHTLPPSTASDVAALVEEYESAGDPGGSLPPLPAGESSDVPAGDPAEPDEPAAGDSDEPYPEDPAGPDAENSGSVDDSAAGIETGADFPEGAGSPPPGAAAADVYGLGLSLAEAAAGRPLDPADIGRIGRSIAPAGAGTAAMRNLTRLAPLLVQATVASAHQRLAADELALALRATAEMFPPPERLDAAFRRVEESDSEPAPSAAEEVAAAAMPKPRRDVLMRLVAAVAVAVAGALLVVFTAGSDGTPSHTVPDVAGQEWAQASETLEASGWEVRRLEVRVADARTGEVVGQLPEPGGLLDEGQVVKVQVNLGEPLVIVPADIVGTTLEEAGLRLSAIGLEVGAVFERVDPGVPEGAVVEIAELLPELPRGSQVDLVIAVAG